MARGTKETGPTTKCMAKGFIHGLMEGSMMETTKKTRSMAWGHTPGLMGRGISVSGETTRGTEEVIDS